MSISSHLRIADAWTALHVVCDNGDSDGFVAVARALVARDRALLSAQATNGETALHRACSKGHVHIAAAMLDMGAGE